MLPRVRSLQFRHGLATLRYDATGTGEPVVLIHGLSGSSRWWRHNVPVFARSHRVFVLDLAGYGRARRQRSLGVREDAALIAAWLDNQQLQHVTLIGHSMGGHIALRVAALRPERVKNLVLACASGLLDGHPVRVALKLPRAVVTGRKSFVPRILLDAARAGLPNMWRSTMHLLGDNVLDVLPGLNVRTLVIWGARDALVPARLGRALAAAIPGARYEEIKAAGHVVMVDAPERFNSLVLDFLGEGTAQ
jgi:pimeloyl-ACP methyl ester carboxylesterase